MKLEKIVASYLTSMKANGKTPATLSSYATTLKRFTAWADENGIEEVEAVRPADVDAYKNERSEAISPTSLNLELTHLRCFFGWAFDMEYINRSPVKKSIAVERSALRSARNKAYENILDAQDIVNIFTNTHPANTYRAEYTRNLAILALFLTTGLRNSSISSLKLSDIDWAGKRIKVDTAKGGKSGYVTLTDAAADTLRAYLADHPVEGDGFLFTRRDENGKPVPFTRQHLSNIIAAAVQSYTGKQGFRSHSLRHSFATFLAGSGFSDREISLLLFHSDGTGASVTRRYIEEDNSWLFSKVNETFKGLLSGRKLASQIWQN